MIPYSKQFINKKDITAVNQVLKSKYITQGKKIIQFENLIKKKVNSKFSLVFNSATSALFAACKAINLNENDNVWVPANSFVATANAVIYCRAKINFIDIDRLTFNICLKELENKLYIAKKNKQLPKAIIIVHIGGSPTDIQRIYQLKKKYKFFLIEDASHALGSSYLKNKIGSCFYSDFTIFSFHAVKIITTGEGGALTFKNKKFYNFLKQFREHGIEKNENNYLYKKSSKFYYEQQSLGYNFRMTDIQAALGISQLQRLDLMNKKRLNLAKNYINFFNQTEIQTQLIIKNAISSYHLFIINFSNFKKGFKDIIQDELLKNNIYTTTHYIPIPSHPFYKKMGFNAKNYPNSLNYYLNSLSIPLFPSMTNAVQDKIFKIIKRNL